MCSCGHGVSIAAMDSSPSFRLRLCASPSCTFIPPSLVLPSRGLHPPNSVAARCSWSRTSFATLREDVTISREQLQQESSSSSSTSSEPQQRRHRFVSSENLNGAGSVGVERTRVNANGFLNDNSVARRELVEEFLFTQDYLGSLIYDSANRSHRTGASSRRKIWVKVESSATRLRPKLGSATPNVERCCNGLESNVHTFGPVIDGFARAGRLPNAFGAYGLMISKSSTRVSGLFSTRPREAGGNELVTICYGSRRRPGKLYSTRPSLGATPVEFVAETSTEEKPRSNSREKLRRGGGSGGRQRLRARGQSGVAKEAPKTSYAPKLEWLKQEGIDLTDECILDQDELCSRSATGLLKLQQTIWRINRSISRCSSLTEALEVVNEMKVAGIDAANEGTYLALISVCRRQQEGERALSIYEAMKEAGVKPGVLTYNTVISCCQQSKRLEDAFRIKREMEAAGLKPDVVTYTALMALVVKTGPYRGRSSPTQRLEKALQLYQEMMDRNIRPDSITYNTLMFAGAQAKMPGKVLEVYRTMVAAGVPPDQFTFGFILESAGAGGRLKVALEIFEEMRAAGIAPKTSTYNFLIEACASAPTPDAEKAWALLEEMKTVKGVVPNAQTYNHLISASCKGGDHAGALKAYDLMQLSGYQRAVTSATFNKLIQSASQTEGLESARQMFRRMLDLGYKPDAITYSTLVVACTRVDNLNQALLICREMEELGVKPNQVVRHSIIGAFGQAGQWKDAVATFRALQEGEEQLTSVSYSIIFDACFGKGGAEGALKQTEAGKLEITPGIEAAIGLYEEAAEVGFYTNFTQADLARCDVRTMSISGTVVAILAWLLRIGESLPASDILIITGVKKNVAAGKLRKVRYTKNHTVALSTLKAVGVPCKALDTATMQALTVSGAEIKQWLEGAQGESDAHHERGVALHNRSKEVCA